MNDATPRPPRPEESDEELLPEDEKFFMEHGEYLSILDNMPTDGNKTSRRKKNVEKVNKEEMYEAAGARHNREWEEKKKPTKLPVMVGSKMVVPKPEVEEEEEPEDESEEDEEVEDVEMSDVEQLDDSLDSSDFQPPKSKKEASDDENDDMADLSPEEIELRVFMKRQEKISLAKQQIALLASSVLEDPEENVRLSALTTHMFLPASSAHLSHSNMI